MEHILSADEIWAAHDIREHVVEVPEWGGSVRVRALNLKQISAIAAATTKRNPRTGQDDLDREQMMLRTLIEGIIEPPLSMADATKLQEKSAAVVSRIVQAISELGPTEEAINGAAKSDAPELDGAGSVLASSRTAYDESRTTEDSFHL